MSPASFNDLRVLALESRHAKEISKLIASYGGRPTVAPAVREVSNRYEDLGHMRVNIEEFIERYYNRLRLHSALGYRSPEESTGRRSQTSPTVAVILV